MTLYRAEREGWRGVKREPEVLTSAKRWSRMANGHYLARVAGGAYLITRRPYGQTRWTFEVYYAADGVQFKRIPLAFSCHFRTAFQQAQDHYDKMTEGK